jgi:hypothetical protein
MTLAEFKNHLPIIIEERQFEIVPMPRNVDRAHRIFKFQDYDNTHVKMLDDDGALLYLSLNMIKLINPGRPPVLRTRRQITLEDKAFV